MCVHHDRASATLNATVIAGDRLTDDYCVWHEERGIGRIMRTIAPGGAQPWDWMVNPPLPIPAWAKGSADTIEQAKNDFKEAWQRFDYDTLSPGDIALLAPHD